MNHRKRGSPLSWVFLFILTAGSPLFGEESSKTKVTGQLNAGYTFNFNNPPAVNLLRIFDNRHNSFVFDLAEIAIENTPNTWSKLRLDLNFGSDIAAVDALKGGVIGIDEFGIQQATAELTAPVGKGLTFKFGHFVTLFGFELIESAYNLNTSRSFLFGFAQPATHTGLLITYPFSEKISGTVGVVNGWDVVGDNNKGKTILAQLAIKPTPALAFFLGGTAGPEQAGSEGNWRGLVDFIGSWTPTDRWTIAVNYDWGREEGSLGASGSTNWQGGMLTLHYKATDRIGLTARGEVFQDDGSRLLLGGKTTVLEGTGTLHVYLGDGWETRLEFRHDHADRSVFARSSGAVRRFQDTISTEVVYAF